MLRFILSLLSATVLLGAPLLGQETEVARTPAQEIAAGIAGLQNKYFEFDLSVKGDLEEAGFQGATGHVVWAGTRHFSIEFSSTAVTDLGEEEESFKAIANGTDIYLESAEGIIKLNLDALTELSPQLMAQITEEGLSVGAEEEGPDFETVLAEALSKVTIKAIPSPAGSSDRRYTVVPEPVVEVEATADGPEGNVGEVKETEIPGFTGPDITVAFGKDHWLPTSIKVDAGEDGFMEIAMGNIRFTEAFPEDAFAYSPPDGAMVQDMTPMLQMMAMQMGEQPDDEDELEF